MELTLTEAERANQRLWDELAPVHFRAYREVQMLRAGQPVLDDIELDEIGDVQGRSLLHLQCHIGTDTLDWERRGAQVTGIDFSARSIDMACRLRDELGLQARFMHASVYDLPAGLQESFDIVYTSRGVLCWLRDLERWGRIIAGCLKPGGIAYVMDTHPSLCIFDDTVSGALRVAHDYFHSPEPIVWDDAMPDYADSGYVAQGPSHEWTWSLGDIVNALLNAGLRLELLNEYDRLFFQALPDMVECRDRWYHLPDHAGRLPLLFTLRARRPA